MSAAKWTQILPANLLKIKQSKWSALVDDFRTFQSSDIPFGSFRLPVKG